MHLDEAREREMAREMIGDDPGLDETGLTLLGLSRPFTEADVRRAYREKSKRLLPTPAVTTTCRLP